MRTIDSHNPIVLPEERADAKNRAEDEQRDNAREGIDLRQAAARRVAGIGDRGHDQHGAQGDVDREDPPGSLDQRRSGRALDHGRRS